MGSDRQVVIIGIKLKGIKKACKKLDKLIAKIEEVQTRAGELASSIENSKFNI